MRIPSYPSSREADERAMNPLRKREGARKDEAKPVDLTRGDEKDSPGVEKPDADCVCIVPIPSGRRGDFPFSAREAGSLLVRQTQDGAQ
jgi:hypothetical protein